MTGEPLPAKSKRTWIRGNASLTVEIRQGMHVMALGEYVTTEEACELISAVLPLRSPFDPPQSKVEAATAEVRRILLDEWSMDHLAVDDGADEEFARRILRAAGVEDR